MNTAKITVGILVIVLLIVTGCVSTAEKPAPVAEPALAAPDIKAPALRIASSLGAVLTNEFTAEIQDVYFEYAVEKGAKYDIFVVDGYNNGKNSDMKVEGAAKAVGFWILRSDAKTTYPQSVYAETDDDSKSGYGFIGFTLDGVEGPVATVQAQDTVLFVHVQRYKPTYTGKFMVKVIKK